ncbi:MAG: S-layer homology domain-containing protein [Proteobacteria bacterium]|nr:S-layer homology domain-containing protein [Pseudomonadota bacterium]
MKQHSLRYGLMSCLCTAALTLLGSGHAMACSPDDFTDVTPNTWVDSIVYYACQYNFPPKSSSKFGTEDKITRGEAAYILSTVFGYGKSSSTDYKFNDIKGHQYAGYIQRLAEKDIVAGDGSGGYRPDDYLARYEATSLFVNVFNISFPSTATKSYFSDVSSSEWYAGRLQALYEACICNGDENGRFNPKSAVTRIQLAAFIVRGKGKKQYCDGQRYYDSCSNGAWHSKLCSDVCNVAGGGCVECYYDTDCSGGYYCVSQKCVECKRNSDCGSGMTCSGGTCVECTGSGSQCKNNKIQVCSGGHWVDQTSCPMGCNSSGTACAECSGSGYQCEDNMEFICNNGVKSSMVSCGSAGCSNNHCASCVNGTTQCEGSVYGECKNGNWITTTCGKNEKCVQNTGCVENVAEQCTSSICLSPSVLNECIGGSYHEKECGKTEICQNNACVPTVEQCTSSVCLTASVLNECVGGSYHQTFCGTDEICQNNACVKKPEEAPGKCEQSVCLTDSVLNECVDGNYQQKFCDSEEICQNNACVPADGSCKESVCLTGSVLNECIGGQYQQKVCEPGQECKNNACVEASVDKPDCTEDALTCDGSNLMRCSSGKLVLEEACKNGCVDNDSKSFCGECSEDSCIDEKTLEKCDKGKKKTITCKLSSCVNGQCQTDMECKKAGKNKCAKDADTSDDIDEKGILICGEDFIYHYEICSGSCENGQCSSKEASCTEGEVECIEASKSAYVCTKGKRVKQCSDDEDCYDKYCGEDGKKDDDPEEEGETGVISSGSCSQQSGHGAIGWLLLPVVALIYRRRRGMC